MVLLGLQLIFTYITNLILVDTRHFRLIWKVPLRPPLLLVDIKESIYIYHIYEAADHLDCQFQLTAGRWSADHLDCQFQLTAG